MTDLAQSTIHKNSTVEEGLRKLNLIPDSLVLFVLDEDAKLVGTLTDGDVRRGLLQGKTIKDKIADFMHRDFRFIRQGNFHIDEIERYKEQSIYLLPLLDKEDRLVKVLNLKKLKSVLPAEAVIMAGGKGQRLRPLTLDKPKPLLKVGDKPILEYNIDRLRDFGIQNIHITIKYLGDQIIEYFGDGKNKGLEIAYFEEAKPMGTIGSLAAIGDITCPHVLLMNSDLLTNIDLHDFFRFYQNSGADMAVASIPYEVNIPYAVLETDNNNSVKSLKEKPTYTYYSNAGIYFLKKEIIDLIPKAEFFDAPDLMDKLIQMGRKVAAYPLHCYWLDIGKHHDYEKAQEDIKHIKL